MIALAVAVLITFIGGLWFIAHNKTEEAVILPSHGNHTGNGLPPKPEERWRYIKELENRQIGVQSPTEPSAGGEVNSPAQLTGEQRQLLEQMQADMRQQPTHLNEVPYNDQVKSAARTRAPAMQAPQQTQQPVRQGNPFNQQPVAAPRQQQPSQPTRQAPISQIQPTPARPTPAPVPAPQPARQAPVASAPVPAPAAKPTRPEAPVETKTEAKTEAKTEKEPKEKSQRWVIQCGSFKAMDQAESIRAQLAFGGIESRITTSGGWNRVMLGPYASRAIADKSLQNLRSNGVSNCIPIAAGG